MRKRGYRSVAAVAVALAAISSAVYADVPKGPVQLDATHTFANGTITENGAVVMTVKSQQADRFSEGHQVATTNNTPVFSVVMMKMNGFKVSTVEFPMLNRNFEAKFPADTTIIALLQSYLKNGVIVANKANAAGLNAYCAQKGLLCKDTRAQIARETAAANKHQCQQCREDYRACQVQKSGERQHPRPGVTVETAESSCEHRYRACSFGGDMFIHGVRVPKPDEWPCGKIEQ